MALFTFTSVVQILDNVDKNHMNTHYFRCSDINKLIIITIILIIIIIIIIIIMIIIIIIINKNNNNRKIKHYTSFSDRFVNSTLF